MFFVAFLNRLSLSEPSFPVWPKQYHLKGTWNIPAWQLRIPFEVDTDEEKGIQSDRSYTLEHNIHFKNYRNYFLQTSIEEGGQTCLFQILDATADDPLIDYLPKNTNNEWSYDGETVVLGKQAYAWSTSNSNGNYTFYVDKESGLPLRYYQDGVSIRSSHPTIYIFDITDYSPFANTSNFLYPATGCRNIDPNGPQVKRTSDHGAHIKKGTEPAYQCVNITSSELESVNINGISSFSWRDVPGVVPLVRDQSNCGSCWAQSATEAISSQFSLRKSGNVTVSVQQMIDCAWVTNTSQACQGGEGYDGYGYYAEHQINITTEEEYPYLGVSGYCQQSFGKVLGRVTGCKRVSIDDSDRTINVLKALYKYGPLMIYINSPHSFYDYKSGIFDDAEECANINEHDQTNHGVLLTGWKTMVDAKTNEEVLTYEIMNSWSPRWGDQGFAYISSKNDCGVPVYPLLPEVEIFYD